MAQPSLSLFSLPLTIDQGEGVEAKHAAASSSSSSKHGVKRHADTLSQLLSLGEPDPVGTPSGDNERDWKRQKTKELKNIKRAQLETAVEHENWKTSKLDAFDWLATRYDEALTKTSGVRSEYWQLIVEIRLSSTDESDSKLVARLADVHLKTADCEAESGNIVNAATHLLNGLDLWFDDDDVTDEPTDEDRKRVALLRAAQSHKHALSQVRSLFTEMMTETKVKLTRDEAIKMAMSPVNFRKRKEEKAAAARAQPLDGIEDDDDE